MNGAFREMISSKKWDISSKRVIGALTYVMLIIAMIVLAFAKPVFSGLSVLIAVGLISSTSLLS